MGSHYNSETITWSGLASTGKLASKECYDVTLLQAASYSY